MKNYTKQNLSLLKEKKKKKAKKNANVLKSLKNEHKALSAEVEKLSDVNTFLTKPQLDGYTNDMLLNVEKEAYRRRNTLPKIHDKSKLSFYDRMCLGLARKLVQYAVENKKNFAEMAKLCQTSQRYMHDVFQYNYHMLEVQWLLNCLHCLAKKDKKIEAYMQLLEAVSLVPVNKVKAAQAVLQKETSKR